MVLNGVSLSGELRLAEFSAVDNCDWCCCFALFFRDVVVGRIGDDSGTSSNEFWNALADILADFIVACLSGDESPGRGRMLEGGAALLLTDDGERTPLRTLVSNS